MGMGQTASAMVQSYQWIFSPRWLFLCGGGYSRLQLTQVGPRVAKVGESGQILNR